MPMREVSCASYVLHEKDFDRGNGMRVARTLVDEHAHEVLPIVSRVCAAIFGTKEKQSLLVSPISIQGRVGPTLRISIEFEVEN